MERSGMGLHRAAELDASQGYTAGEVDNIPPMRGTGEGDLISNVVDLGKFATAMLNEKMPGLSSKQTANMLEAQGVTTIWDLGNPFGLGWHLGELPEYPGVKTIYHDGGTGPFSSSLVILPQKKLGIVVLANSDELELGTITTKVLQHELRQRGIFKTKTLPPKTAALDHKFLGEYASEFGTITLSKSWSLLKSKGIWLLKSTPMVNTMASPRKSAPKRSTPFGRVDWVPTFILVRKRSHF